MPTFSQGVSESINGFSRKEIVKEVEKQMLLAGPLISLNFFTFVLQVISVMFCGRLGELQLAGASMATSFASVTGFSLLRGMGSALETFCGQSYGGQQYQLLGVHLQRAMVVLLLASIPLAAFWANVAQILVFLRQDREISAEAGLYARFMIPSIFGFAIQECHIRFLQSQGNVVPMMISSGITAALHILICWALVLKSGLGIKGAALSNSVSCWINACLLMVYVRLSPSCKKTWTGFSKDAFRGILSFVKLSIPSAIMLSLEIWSFEMLVLLSGLLPDPKFQASVMSISFNTAGSIYMILVGLSCAVSTRVSNELGAGRPRAAYLAVCVSVVISATEGIAMGAILIIGRKLWGHIFISDKRVVHYAGKIYLLIAALHFVDGIQSVLSGTARGCGWQKIGAIINLGAYYLVGIPCSVILAFLLHLGVKGLWTGIILALVAQALGLLIVTLRTNWEKERRLVKECKAILFLRLRRRRKRVEERLGLECMTDLKNSSQLQSAKDSVTLSHWMQTSSVQDLWAYLILGTLFPL